MVFIAVPLHQVAAFGLLPQVGGLQNIFAEAAREAADHHARSVLPEFQFLRSKLPQSSVLDELQSHAQSQNFAVENLDENGQNADVYSELQKLHTAQDCSITQQVAAARVQKRFDPQKHEDVLKNVLSESSLRVPRKYKIRGSSCSIPGLLAAPNLGSMYNSNAEVSC